MKYAFTPTRTPFQTHNVPVILLAGGLGTRLSEESHLRPKPMIEIGGIPILIHIMRWYYHYGFNDFVICGGYRCWDIKEYLLNYRHRANALHIDNREGKNEIAIKSTGTLTDERWRVRVFDTGLESMTGSRLAQVLQYMETDAPFKNFALTYSDGLSNVDLRKELRFHMNHGKIGTLLGVPPPVRFGELSTGGNESNEVLEFIEKPENRSGLINGGFFFFKYEFQQYVSLDPTCILERAPLENLAKNHELRVFKHHGFWHPMDTLRDKNHLQQIWDQGMAPWITKHSTEILLKKAG